MTFWLPFDMKVLSASASNEGWYRRDWRHICEQRLGCVPVRFEAQLFPAASSNADLDTEDQPVRDHTKILAYKCNPTSSQ
jgi:hypothetical protein